VKTRCVSMVYAGHVKHACKYWDVVTRRVKSMSTYYSMDDVARQVVVESSSSQPRIIGQTAYEAAQALAQFSIKKYTSSGTLKNAFFQERKRMARKLPIQAACGAVRATRGRQRAGISFEIET
jgi:hypothetical protein